MKLLDTTFLVDYERGEEAVAEFLTVHEDGEEFVTSTICMKELAVGKHAIGSPSKADLVGDYGWLRIVPFTIEHAHEAGVLEATLRADETRRDRVASLAGDVLIAGVASHLDAAVVTRNTDDFEAFEDVAVDRY
ncbi:PIN domain-containing protein [Halalkalicoccus sp. NIPERK01]|uniref:PIN domain-containing protein n=1 Tax=Halalkalicoccus sp. NIPERK01 TaxID=3053469 RepID=UPI00256EE25B|nr:PIN domain-containing protein [Halalkalicoccus sp. NIPERK01]MDL5361426.1 PIN domain-containing protein [Halalkalicoccus sp. NIPERK01]